VFTGLEPPAVTRLSAFAAVGELGGCGGSSDYFIQFSALRGHFDGRQDKL